LLTLAIASWFAVIFADAEKTILKVADFGLAWYIAPGEKIVNDSGVRTTPDVLELPY
jgi:hypothetical protein